MAKDIEVRSIKGTYKFEFYVLVEAINTIPHSDRIYIPKDARKWLEEYCEEECYLVLDPSRTFMKNYYLALFVNPSDAFFYRLVWG